MKTRELSEGDVVLVVLPYEGGRGWASIDALSVASEPPNRARTVRVSFLPGSGPGFNRTRLVRPHDIVRKRTEGDEDPGASADAVAGLDRLLDFALLPDHVQELGQRLQTERDEFSAALERIAAGDFPAATAADEMQHVAEAALGDSTVTRLKYVLIVERDTGDGDGLYVFADVDEELGRRYAACHAGASMHREVLMDRATASRLVAATSDETEDAVRNIGTPQTARYRCPSTARSQDDVVGCGAIFDAAPDSEGLVDCPACGMWFDPSDEQNTVIADPATDTDTPT
jgi:hypothetical protein